MTLETKPQRKDQRTVLCHMAGLQPGGQLVSATCRAGPRGPCTLADSVVLWEIRWDEQGCSASFTHSQALSLIHCCTGHICSEPQARAWIQRTSDVAPVFSKLISSGRC